MVLLSDNSLWPIAFQSGLKISCKVTTKLPTTIKKYLVMDQYKELAESLYCEPKHEKILGLFLFTIPGPALISSFMPPPNKKKKKKKRMCQPKTRRIKI